MLANSCSRNPLELRKLHLRILFIYHLKHSKFCKNLSTSMFMHFYKIRSINFPCIIFQVLSVWHCKRDIRANCRSWELLGLFMRHLNYSSALLGIYKSGTDSELGPKNILISWNIKVGAEAYQEVTWSAAKMIGCRVRWGARAYTATKDFATSWFSTIK